MCICSGPAHLASTRIYAGESVRDGRPVHTLIYQNEAVNQADGPNCMLLHLPSAEPMTRANAVDVPGAGTLLTELIDAVKPKPRSVSLSAPAATAAAVFEYGIYTVVLSPSPARILDALDQVPARKRPRIRPALLDFYAEHFPGWTLALCCFDNRDQQRAQPLVWWYRPMFPDTLFAPGIDAHTGDPPDLDTPVDCDHQVVFGTTRPGPRPNPALDQLRDRYSGPLADVLPRCASYTQFWTANTRKRYRNADFTLDIATLLDSPWTPIQRRGPSPRPRPRGT